MKIVQQTTTITLGLYHLTTIGQVYSRDVQHGTRVETRFYMRTNAGMVCLDNGAFIPASAYTDSNGAHHNHTFRPEPGAKLVV